VVAVILDVRKWDKHRRFGGKKTSRVFFWGGDETGVSETSIHDYQTA